MPHPRQRTFTAILATLAAVVGLSLVSVGAATAASGTTSSGAGHSAKNGKVDTHVDQQQKDDQARSLAAPCYNLTTKEQAKGFARCFAMGRTNTAHDLVVRDDGPPATAMGPADIQSAYDLPDSGAGQTVAIVDAYGYATAESDLAVFRAYYGLPACTTDNGCFKKVDQTGGTNYPPEDAGWSIETSLDLDAVSSACPKCHILLVEGDDPSFDNLGVAVDTAASLGAVAISNSYGVPGDFPEEQTYDHYYDHPGIAVVASTGDTGDVTNWPATSDNVAGIGGTTLTKDSSPRGWTESAWADGGSGCSPYEPRPDYQAGLTTNCPDNKAIADISADADPATGLGIYNSSAVGGWAQYGGTSLSSPLIGAMYALAGNPVPDTYPVSYPYDDPSHLNDVTAGANGSCGNVLCEAGPGWDGPTGLGTPNGVDSLTTGPHGTVAGTVTNQANGNPIQGATISTADGYSATTDSSGSYTLAVPVGTYDVKASAFGFASKTATGVAVDQGQTVTESFALSPVASHTVSGTVTDGSGQGWPIYAKITVNGTPASTYTDPYTGRYSVSLPSGSTYTVHADSQYPGYLPIDKTVTVGDANKTVNLEALVDPSTCSAKGYAYQYNGTSEDFTGWTGKTPQDGWTITDGVGNGQTWDFDNPGAQTPPPGSDGDFAIVDSDNYGIGNTQDTTLLSPVIDMSSQTSPELGFDTDYNGISGEKADVDVSTDGGTTWTNVWEQTTTDFTGHVDIPLPDAAGKSQVQVRFHYIGSWSWWWSTDNVFAGNRECAATDGGLVAGIVRDGNTNQPVNGAKVASVSNPDELGVSAATPDDANVPDGFYWLFSSATGRTKFQATDGKYTSSTAFVNVQPGWTTHKNWSLAAGHLTVSPSSISDTLRLGASKSETLTFGNDGTKPVHVDLSEQNGAFTPMVKGKGAPVQHIKGTFTTKALVTAKKPAGQTAPEPKRSAKPSAAPWTDIADFPTPTMDNAVAYGDGKVYSIAGYNGTANVADGFVYDSTSQAWTPIADAPAALEAPAAAYAGGTVYLVGGWDEAGDASDGVYAYDPGADSWAQVADLPEDISAASTAVVDGDLYVIGGCTTADCAPATTKVYRYDPAADSWTAAADYPQPIAFTACAGLGTEIACAGGVNATTNVTSTATYTYSPTSDSWTQKADMPADLWAGAASGAGGKLQVSSGVVDNSATVTNEGYEYDPTSDSWADLPAANNAEYRGGGSCGMYKVGGSTGGFAPEPFAEVLPGYDQCGGGAADVPWLSEDPTGFDVAPGGTVKVTVTLDASAVDQPGTYEAKVGIATDSPYQVDAVPVTMDVTPPASWGKVRGTVTDTATGNPIAGATVEICTMYDAKTGNCGQVEYTLKTDADGSYQLWLDRGFNPLQVIAAKDGYSPKSKIVKIVKGGTVTTDFALKKS